MAAPNGSAIVPPGQRFRLVYQISAGFLSVGYFQEAADALTARWQSNLQAVVVSPASEPVLGGANVLGRTQAFTTLDAYAVHALPTLTWDQYLHDYRNPSLGLLLELDMDATLDSVELLAAPQLSPTLAPAARTAATQTPATASQQSSTSPGMLLSQLAKWAQSTENRLILLALLVLLVVLAWQFGPELAKRLKARPA